MRLGIGLTLLLPVVLLAIFGPILLADPQLIDIRMRNAAPLAGWAHPLGTDLLGRDTLVRLAHGLRLSLITGLISLLGALIIGVFLGLLILARQPRFTPIIVKTISQIMVLFWVITMSVFLYVTLVTRTDTFEWSLSVISYVVLFCAAVVLLGLRKKSSFLPDVVERTRWTGTGWRILRLLLAVPMVVPCYLIAIYLMEGTREFLPTTLVIGISAGLIIAPFTLRTTLAAGQPKRAIKAIGLGVFSTMAWAILGGAYLGFVGLGFVGLGPLQDTPNLGHLTNDTLPDPNVQIIALLVLSLMILGLVLTGDGIRHAILKRHS